MSLHASSSIEVAQLMDVTPDAGESLVLWKLNLEALNEATPTLENHSATEAKMKPLQLLVCLGLVCVVASTLPFDPRGSRPVEPGTRSETCASQKEWPFCTDEDWGRKCPSGCRIQGLMDKYDHKLVRKVEKIRSILDENRVRHRSTDQVSKQTYDYLKDKLTIDSGHGSNYYDLAQSLRQRINEMKIKIDRQLRLLGALKDRVKDQVVEMQRLEVDIDIKLRSCKGSCSSYSEHEVDKEGYVELNKQINQLDSRSAQNIQSAGTLYVMKSRLMKDVHVDSIFKSASGPTTGAQQTQDIFADVKNIQLILESEGSSASPATITKDPGTSYSKSTTSSSSSDSSSSSKSITEHRGDGSLFGEGFGGHSQPSTGHTTTKTISCTKSIKRTIVQTRDGPVEKVEEVIEGGPECRAMAASTKPGMSSIFPTFGHSSSGHSSSGHTSSGHTSSSSSITTQTHHAGGAKGSITEDTKPGFMNLFGSDIGGFMTDNPEQDHPDVHARSVKSARVQRQADYVGKDCVEAHQNHLNGETNGLFKIKPGGTDSMGLVAVYCQQEGPMGGWLLVQQRESGALSFNRTWAEYRDGFGSVDAQGKGEFWLGNQNLHLLTNQGETMMQVELEDWDEGVATAEYTVRVGSEGEGYALHVSGYTGDAGDGLVMPKSDVSHNGMKFSTFDTDNDRGEENCAAMYGGGWWYNNCQSVNLNGIYYKGTYDPEKNTPYKVENGVVWVTYKPTNYSLKSVKVFIRSTGF
ncbi:fibrinogen alpha chain isoform X2 [Hippoglossus stenolepis]|uniref:fibrinogen alpha chain isoform X2 n=1 Tax=Hippoglossus stenolepis TaxID=195615 RepID=UPI001FAFBF94|nr:fibrinogen alpha chain isoform X2 [Hippoglossus stenolepis]